MSKKDELKRLREIIDGLNMIIEVKDEMILEQQMVISGYRSEMAEMNDEFVETMRNM